MSTVDQDFRSAIRQCLPVVQWLMEEVTVSRSLTPALIQRTTRKLGAMVHLRQLVADLAIGTLQAQRLGKGRPGWLFTPRMAEQGSHPEIARYHAQAFADCSHVLEICTGAGLDAAALSTVADHVTTYESDPVTAEIARLNFETSGSHNITVVHEPWQQDTVIPPGVDGIWADPSRRSPLNRRTRSAADYDPPLESIFPSASTTAGVRVVGIKVGPGDQLPEWASVRLASEFIGFGRECRERILWWGTDRPRLSVVLVDKPGQPPFVFQNVLKADPTVMSPSDLKDVRWLIEPHNAVIAAGMVEQLFLQSGVRALDPMIAYGVGMEQPSDSVFYDRFNIVAIDEGVSERRIRERVRELGWNSRTEIKKRGWDQDPEVLRTRITFPNTNSPGVIIVTRRGSTHLTIYAVRP